MSRFPANSACRVRSPDFIYLISAAGYFSVKLGVNNTRFLVPVQYYFILHQATIKQCRQQQDTSQAAILTDGVMAAEWPRRRVQWCSPCWCTGSDERLNWNNNLNKDQHYIFKHLTYLANNREVTPNIFRCFTGSIKEMTNAQSCSLDYCKCSVQQVIIFCSILKDYFFIRF